MATFTNQADGKPVILKLSGNFVASSIDITNKVTGQVVAHIDRKLLGWRELAADADTYTVTVAPGMDIAIVLAMCAALDEY